MPRAQRRCQVDSLLAFANASVWLLETHMPQALGGIPSLAMGFTQDSREPQDVGQAR